MSGDPAGNAVHSIKSLIIAINGISLQLAACNDLHKHRARMGFGKLWRLVMPFQDLESFGKGRFFKMVIETFCGFVCEILKHSELDVA